MRRRGAGVCARVGVDHHIKRSMCRWVQALPMHSESVSLACFLDGYGVIRVQPHCVESFQKVRRHSTTFFFFHAKPCGTGQSGRRFVQSRLSLVFFVKTSVELSLLMVRRSLCNKVHRRRALFREHRVSCAGKARPWRRGMCEDVGLLHAR